MLDERRPRLRQSVRRAGLHMVRRRRLMRLLVHLLVHHLLLLGISVLWVLGIL